MKMLLFGITSLLVSGTVLAQNCAELTGKYDCNDSVTSLKVNSSKKTVSFSTEMDEVTLTKVYSLKKRSPTQIIVYGQKFPTSEYLESFAKCEGNSLTLFDYDLADKTEESITFVKTNTGILLEQDGKTLECKEI